MKKWGAVFQERFPYKAFLMSLITFGLSYGFYKGVIDNYLAEMVSMTAFDKGVSEFFRELPGLLLVVILAVFYTSPAERIYKIGAVIMVVGMTLQGILPYGKAFAIFAIFLYSMGDHMQQGTKNSITLGYAKEKHGGEALGVQNSIYQIGTLVGYVVIIVVFAIFADASFLYRPIFLCSAAIIAIGFLFTLQMTSISKTDKSKSRFYFRKKYRKYYMLEVFYGARKQVFFTFGPYVLVLFYGADAMTISLLFAISAICCFFAAPIVGKIIDRLGYKVVMISDTLILVIVCFFYGFAHHIFPMPVAFVICCVNYILDSVISLASMASNVYVQDISDTPEEVKATLSTGLSVNHAITILIALSGGWIWQTLGIETLFVLSAVLGLCNSAYAATIKVKK